MHQHSHYYALQVDDDYCDWVHLLHLNQNSDYSHYRHRNAIHDDYCDNHLVMIVTMMMMLMIGMMMRMDHLVNCSHNYLLIADDCGDYCNFVGMQMVEMMGVVAMMVVLNGVVGGVVVSDDLQNSNPVQNYQNQMFLYFCIVHRHTFFLFFYINFLHLILCLIYLCRNGNIQC